MTNTIKKIGMTTTDEFQRRPEYWTSEEECLSHMRDRIRTNPRYEYFFQTHFTAGDEEQFERYRNPTNGKITIPTISLDDNRFADMGIDRNIDWKKYRDLDTSSVIDTFRYIFHKFKKGIFVQIRNNNLRVFLPFSKVNCTNEWGDKMRVDPSKFKDMNAFLGYANEMEGRKFNPRRVNRFTDKWYGNNCLVRYEFPVGEGESGVPMMADMLKELCKHRRVPDIEFFINRRDFPIITRDGTEPYEHMFGDQQPLVSHNNPKYSSILAGSTTDKDADIPMPTWEDWQRASSQEDGKFFLRTGRDYRYNFDIPWKNKKPTAVFRGGSTGYGTTIDTNMRLKVAYLSATTEPEDDGIRLLDAGITKWNTRPRKIKNNPYLQTIDVSSLPFNKVEKLSPKEQSAYKYVIDIQGHVSAYRLSLELSMGSVVLLMDSPYRLWYTKYLKPYVHYVPVKDDLSDLIKQIKWCRNHDAECEKIAENARKFYETYLRKDGILDYLQNLFIHMKRINRIYIYNTISPMEFQMRKKTEVVRELMDRFPQTKQDFEPRELPPYPRSYSLMEGIRWAINRLRDKNLYLRNAGEIKATKLCRVRRYEFANSPILAIKESVDPMKEREGIHETFVGLTCINNLSKRIPNFSYNFGYISAPPKLSVMSEYIAGETFDIYLARWKDFSLEEYLWILLQISLALYTAQNACGFVHYDLVPWNIIIQRVRNRATFDYLINGTETVRITTSTIPIILDYGKSTCIYKNRYYGIVQPYKTSTVHDILSLLLTSLYAIVSKRVHWNRKENDMIIKLANFFGGTRYTNGKKFQNLSQIKTFTNQAKKYAEILQSNKYELEERNPLDLYNYIRTNFDLSRVGTMQEVQDLRTFSRGNPRQVYEFIFSKNEQERVDSFANVFTGITTRVIPQPSNLFSRSYAIQTLYQSLSSTYELFLVYLRSISRPNETYRKMYNLALEYLERIYVPNLEIDPEPLSFSRIRLGGDVEYTRETFGDISSMKNTLRLILVQDIDPDQNVYSRYKVIVQSVILYSGKYSLTEEQRRYYITFFDDLLEMKGVVLLRNISNCVTFIETCKDLVLNDSQHIRDKMDGEEGDCETAKEYLKTSEEILNMISGDKIQ